MKKEIWQCTHELLAPEQVHYCRYISLGFIHQLQVPNSGTGHERDLLHPDEEIFLSVHQMFERALLTHAFELRRVIAALQENNLGLVEHLLNRVLAYTRFYPKLIRLLTTMGPEDFEKFRNDLAPASGLESEMIRVVELLSGMIYESPYAEDRGRVFTFGQFMDRKPGGGERDPRARLWTDVMTQVAKETNLNQALGGCLVRADLSLEDLLRSKDRSIKRLRGIVDLLYGYDRAFQNWRRVHAKVVEEMIGNKPGTGFTSGLRFLSSVVETAHFFPELWELKKTDG